MGGGLLNLYDYSVKLSRLSEEDGGGWLAEIPELEGCKSDGETPEEALNNIRDALEGWLEVAKEDNKPIPDPIFYKHQDYSGKFTLRLPKALHRFLAKRAEIERVSLNQYILSLISFNAGRQFADCFYDEKEKRRLTKQTISITLQLDSDYESEDFLNHGLFNLPNLYNPFKEAILGKTDRF